MKLGWGMAWLRRRKWLKVGWLITAVWVAVYCGVIQPSQASRGIAAERASGLAAIESSRHWLIPLPQSVDNSVLVAGVVGGAALAPTSITSSSSSDRSPDQKIVRTTSINLIVKSPATSAETIRSLTERAGGFLVQWQTNGAQDATDASVTVRVPVARFEEVRAEIRKLAVRIEGEQLQAEDATRQYVDQQARLRNLRAQEAQYLSILKQARTVKDTLDVSEKLSQVRSEIEHQQAEFEALSKQVETVGIAVSLHSEAEANVLGSVGGLRTNSN
jgi:cell division protein FtsL